MQFLEECRKSEEEGKDGQARVKVKVMAAAVTLPPTENDELSKQLKYQQHQIDALVGQVKDLVSVVRAAQTSRVARAGAPSYGKRTTGVGGGGSWKKGQPSQLGAPTQPNKINPQAGQGNNRVDKQYQCWQCGKVGHLKREYPALKEKGLSKGGIA